MATQGNRLHEKARLSHIAEFECFEVGKRCDMIPSGLVHRVSSHMPCVIDEEGREAR